MSDEDLYREIVGRLGADRVGLMVDRLVREGSEPAPTGSGLTLRAWKGFRAGMVISEAVDAVRRG